MAALFRRSRAHEYQDHQPGSIANLFHGDSIAIRFLVFAIMCLVFFVIFKLTEKQIPRGIIPDNSDTTTAVHHAK